jgi:hypothetical protein
MKITIDNIINFMKEKQKFWIGLAWPVRWTNTQVREHFQSSTPQSMAANGQPLQLLDPLPPLPPQRPRLQHLPQDPG